MQTGFTVLRDQAGVEFQLFGARPPGRLPLVSFAQGPGLWSALMGRLYYRHDLRAGDPEECEDAELALRVYRRSGVEGLTRLEGDFALVLWDARAGRLVGVRDPLGGYPLFWAEASGVVGFSTGVGPLLSLLGRRRLDLHYLADFLMLPGLCVQEPEGDRCAFEGVRRLPAGSLAVQQRGRVEVRSYWDWAQRLVDPGTDDLGQIAEGYGALLRAAVRERLRGRTAAEFSGGMDSTAVGLLAQDWIDRGHGEGPLHTLSLVYERLSGLARERPYLEGVLKEHPELVAHAIPADDLLDGDSLADPPAHEEPWSWLARVRPELAVVGEAERAGVETILTGNGSDELLDLPPFHVADLLRRGRLVRAWREAGRWAGAYSASVRTTFHEFGLAPSVPAWLRDGLRVALRRGYAPWKTLNNYTIAPWVRPEFARRYGMWGRARENLGRTYSRCRPMAVSVAITSILQRCGDLSRRYVAGPRGIHVAHPFFDPRVACFALGALARYPGEPGRRKPILSESMRGVLPEAIRTRRVKGHFGEVCYLGLARNLPHLEDLARSPAADGLGLFDTEELVRCLRLAAMGVPTDFGVEAVARLNQTLALLAWLGGHERWLRAEAPAEVVRAGASPEPAAHGPA